MSAAWSSRHLPRAFALGAAVTLLSGAVPVRSLAGATHYGLPVTWLVRRVLAPAYFPWRVQWFGLAVDLVFWTALALVALAALERRR